MRKHNYFRSGLALILATSMLGSQVAASELPISSQTASETGGTGAVQEGGFSDGTNSGTGQLSLGSADGDGLFCDVSEDVDFTSTGGTQTEFPSVTAVFNVEEVEEQWNTYEVHAEWTIQNVQEQGVSLALGMDRVTYEGLPEAMMADSEGVCKISSKEGTTIPATLQKDPQNAERVLLTWEQTDNGQVSADFTVSAGEADSLSTITAQWHDADTETWTELAKADLNWKKAPDEEENSSPEENPENGEKPSIGEAEPTVTPEAEATVTPEATPEPTPEVTPTVSPEPTEEAEPTVTPEVTPEAEATPTVSPEPTEEAEPTVTPEATPTVSPEPTEIPEVTPTVTPTVIPEEGTVIDQEASVTAHKGSVPLRRTVKKASEVPALSDGNTENETEQLQDTAMAGTPMDLSNYLTNTTATVDQSTNTIQVFLDYSVNTGTLQNAGTNVLTYDIPESIITKKEYKGAVLDGKKSVGTYTITKEGKLTVIFDESYVKGTPADITGTISFWAKASKDKVDDEGKLEIKFNDQYSVVVNIDKNSFNSYDANVDKKCTSKEINKEENKVTFTYQVEITTENGTGTDLNFEDWLQNQQDKAEYSNLVIEKYDANGNKFENFTGSTVDIVEGTSSTDPKLSGSLPALSKNEKYVITYTVDRPLGEGEYSVSVRNDSEVKNKYTGDTDVSTESVSMYDLTVEKKSPNPPVLDKANGTVTNKYEIKISTEMGTKGPVNLTDKIVYYPEELGDTYRHQYKVSSIKKHRADGTEERLPLNNLDVDNQGQLTGSLPELAAGEYYTIEYTTVVDNVPEDSKVEFDLKNQLIVEDEINKKEVWDSDHINWIGKDYVNWIRKTGNYDPATNKIYWTIILNEGGYGDIDGMTLTDTLKFNGKEISLKDTKVQIIEKIPRDGWSEEVSYNDKVTLPYTFKNGTIVGVYNTETMKMDTTHEFLIKYETEADINSNAGFFNKYENVGSIGEHVTPPTDVTIPVHEIEKQFSGSETYTEEDLNGYKLNWQTFIDIPKDGLAKDSYYTDKISDSESRQLNDRNWFTPKLLQDIRLSVGGQEVPKDKYTITCDGRTAEGTAFEGAALSELDSNAQVSGFRITFNEAITGTAENDQLKIAYSSYSNSTKLTYNTGTYTEDGFDVSDHASGKGDDGSLVHKYNADGSSSFRKELAAIKDENVNGEYLLKYKLLINENHSANGTITVTDTLGEGMSLYQESWRREQQWDNTLGTHVWVDPDNDILQNGVYIKYLPYDEKDSYPYSSTNEEKTKNEYFSDSNKNQTGKTAKDYQTTVSYDDASRKLTITIPEDAYQSTGPDGQKINHAMVIYYAVKIDASKMTDYEYGFKNEADVTTTTGQSDKDSLTDTVIGSCIGKSGTYDNKTNTDTIEYSIDINPKGVKLIEDEENVLTVKDTFKYDKSENGKYYIDDANIVPGSLQLYKCVVGENNLIEEVLCNDDIKSSKLEKSNHCSYLTVDVPDGQFYRLKYKYVLTYSDYAKAQINSEDGLPKFGLTNEAKIEGVGTQGTSSSDETEIVASGSGASASKGYANITLYKRDRADETNMLAGAEFELERFNGVSWVKVVNDEPFVTGEDGSVRLGEKLNNDEYRVAINYAYRLREVKAPKGYKIIQDYMYFCVEGNNSNKTVVAPADWNTNEKYKKNKLSVVNNEYLFVSNEKRDEGKTEIEVRKIWKNPDGTIVKNPMDKDGKSISSIKVKLKGRKKSDGTEWDIETLTLSSENNWSALKELDKYDSNTHEVLYYYIEEENVPNGWVVSYGSNGQLIAADSDECLVNVINTSIEDSTSVQVNKKWLKPDGTEYTAAPEKQAQVKLLRTYKIPASADSQGTVGSGENVTITVKFTDKNHTQTPEIKTRTVAKGAEVQLYLESPGFNHLVNITEFSPRVDASYHWTTRRREQENDWVSCETVTFYALSDITLNIGTIWAEFSMGTVRVTSTDPKIKEGDTIQDPFFEETVVLSDSNEWSYHWPALAKTSPYYTPYEYIIKEVPVSGYESTVTSSKDENNSSITVSNQREKGIDTSISVKKKWFYSDGTEIPQESQTVELLPPVELELYRSTTHNTDGTIPANSELVDSVTISGNAESKWNYTWEYLDKYKDNTKGGSPYYYYVKEKGTEYAVSYDNNGVNENSSATPITVKNTVETVEITVNKQWLGIDGTVKVSGIPKAAEVQLYKKGENGDQDIAIGSPVKLGTDQKKQPGYSLDGWSYTWTKLLKGEYYVKETAVEGFRTTYQAGADGTATDTADNASVNNGNITVTNQEIPVEISVTKEWADGIAPQDVKMQLYRSTKSPEKPVKTIMVYFKNRGSDQKKFLFAKQVKSGAFTLFVKKDWQNWWDQFPTLECISDKNVKVADPILKDDQCTFEFHISEISNDCEFVVCANHEPSVDKKEIWIDAGETVTPGSDLILPDQPENPSEAEGATKVPNALIALGEGKTEDGYSNHGWTYTWTNLPRVNEDGELYYYYVKEISDPNSGYVSRYSYTFNEDGSIAGVKVINSDSLTTSITAKKVWKDVQGKDKNPTDWSITLQLYYQKADGTWEPYPIDGTKKITKDSPDASITWEDLPVGKYYVEEIDMNGNSVHKEDYIVSYGNGATAPANDQLSGNSQAEGNAQDSTDDQNIHSIAEENQQLETDPKAAAVMGGSIIVTNTEKSTEISVTKKWSDGRQYHKDDTVTMNLYSSTTDPETADFEYKKEQGKTVTVYYPDYPQYTPYEPYLACGVVLGTTANIKIYYEGHKKDIIAENVSLQCRSDPSQRYVPELINGEYDYSARYLLFKDVDVSQYQDFDFVVKAGTQGNTPYPQNKDANIVEEAGTNPPAFDTLIKPSDEDSEFVGKEVLSNENNWTASWKDLPLSDASGQKLYYYVIEDKVENCSTSYEYTYNSDGSISKVEVTNRPTAGNVNISVDKLWKSADGSVFVPKDERRITVKLYSRTAMGGWEAYRDAKNEEVTATLPSPDGSWSYTFSNLPNGEYCVGEISMDGVVQSNYTTTYQTNVQTTPTEDATQASTEGGKITITNTETPTDITVTKKWDGTPGNSAWMQLYSSTTKPEAKAEESTGTHTIEVIKYESEWYHPTVVNSTAINGNAALIILVYQDIYNAPPTSKNYSLKLLSGSADIKKITSDDVLDYIEIDSTKYPCIMFEASKITENCVFDFIPGDGQKWPLQDKSTVKAINIPAINPKGEWVPVSNALPTDAENVTKVGEKVELTMDNSWTHTWKNLPKYTEAGDPLYYYVEELDCPGYTTTYEHWYREDETVEKVQVTNTPKVDSTEVQVIKQWPGDTPEAVANYKVTVELYKRAADGTETKVEGVEPLVLTASNNWSAIWSNLTALGENEAYYVKETGVTDENDAPINGYIPIYSDNSLSGSGTVKISNWKETDLTSVTVSKKWLKADGEVKESGYPAQISVSLYQQQGDGNYVKYNTVNLGTAYAGQTDYSDDGWSYTWKELPGGKYYVAEEPSVPNYVTFYPITGRPENKYPENAAVEKGEIVINNKEETTEISVEKKWVNTSGATVTEGLPAVTLNVYQSKIAPNTEPEANDLIPKPEDATEVIRTITLDGTAPNGWAYTWSDLPKYDDDGHPYYYYIEETEGEKYNAAYAYTYKTPDTPSSGISKVTITNTKKTQGITLPGTGSKYPLVFYGLGSAFLLISTVWMLLTLKKRNTLIDAGKGGKRSDTK